MAGIGVRLHKIYGRNSIASKMIGFIYSTALSIAPMLLVILSVLVMGELLGFSKTGYYRRELFSCTVLYIFIFSLLVAAPFNSVLSRYLSDIIYKEDFDSIMPCFIIGLLFNIVPGCLIAIPFCIAEYIIGKVSFVYTFTGFCGFVILIFVFYSMLYLNIFKDYKKTSFFFIVGSGVSVLMSYILVKVFGQEVTYSMLLSLVTGFFVIACLEYGTIKRYFTSNSGNYREVVDYFKKYWKLIAANTLYTVGMFIHNFVFWGSDMQMTVAKVFICAPSYDMATCLAMFTNISATVIFITRVEMYFHERYRAYSEAVIGGRGADIENTKRRMFNQMSVELMNLARIQFILSVVIFFICIVILPQIGFSGMIMKIYPSLAAGYFILFTMYSCMVFLYYFNDLNGALMTSLSFCVGVLICSIYSSRLIAIWYGIGVVGGSAAGWTVAYFRIRWIEKHIDEHIFCEGDILEKGRGKKPSEKVFDRYAPTEENDSDDSAKEVTTAAVVTKTAVRREAITESAAEAPEEIPEADAVAVAPEEIPEADTVAVVPEEIPEADAVAVVPEEIPEADAVAVVPEAVPEADLAEEASEDLIQPSFSLSNGIKPDGKKYIEIKLNRYEGRYVEIYAGSGSSFHQIKINNNRIDDNAPVIRINHSGKRSQHIIKIRTYDIDNDIKIYSPFSIVKMIADNTD